MTDRPACFVCGEPASCIGKYAEDDVEDFACDHCCGHGNEDGHCRPIDTVVARWHDEDDRRPGAKHPKKDDGQGELF
jgi:hypothetical protein